MKLAFLSVNQLCTSSGREVALLLVVSYLISTGCLTLFDDDAAARLDPVEPEIVALLGEAAFLRLPSRQRDRRPKTMVDPVVGAFALPLPRRRPGP